MPRAKAFFLKALQPYGAAAESEGSPAFGVELGSTGNAPLCRYQAGWKPAHLHLAVRADNRQQVDAFYRAALAAGGKYNCAPGLCPCYNAYCYDYEAFIIGPNGHNIEAFCNESEADGPACRPASQK